jgi:hypothetical protein
LLQLLQMLLLLHALQICFTIPNLHNELIQFVSSLCERRGGEGTGRGSRDGYCSDGCCRMHTLRSR